MNVTKAIVTAAGKGQRNLPLQTLYDSEGIQKSVLNIIIDEVLHAGITDIGIVIHPDDEQSYRAVAGDQAEYITFIHQKEPRGYGHALWCAKDYWNNVPILHLIGDHLYVSRNSNGCAQKVVEVAKVESCSVSAVQATREGLLPNYGAIGGKRVQNKNNLFVVERVIEKPTPTEAEMHLIVPGLRAGFYLCFFGIHVLTPAVLDILDEELKKNSIHPEQVTLSTALNELIHKQQYLALELDDYRYNVGVKYGLWNAQLALALCGKDKETITSMLMEQLLYREQRSSERTL